MVWIVNALMVVQVLCAASVIILVLLQHGKGADMGAAFGSGASGSLFGASGSANFLSRSTAVVAGLFFLATIGLAYTATNLRTPHVGGVMSTVAPPATPASVPGAPSSPQVPQNAGTPAPSAAKPDGGQDKSSEIPK
jgi:preprotein translocase subunit SecG